MALIRCDHCGAPLEAADGSTVVRCLFCKRDQTVGDLPRALPTPTHTAVEAYVAGERVLCEWRGRWWPASVVAVQPGGQYLIHYDGYSDSWDESVGVDRLEPRPATPPGPPARQAPRPRAPQARGGAGAGVAFAFAMVLVLGGIAAWVVLRQNTRPTYSTTPVQPAGYVQPSGQYTVGQLVQVEWHHSWYDATVIALRSDGLVRIHYTGWSDSWDEDVTLDRIRPR